MRLRPLLCRLVSTRCRLNDLAKIPTAGIVNQRATCVLFEKAKLVAVFEQQITRSFSLSKSVVGLYSLVVQPCSFEKFRIKNLFFYIIFSAETWSVCLIRLLNQDLQRKLANKLRSSFEPQRNLWTYNFVLQKRISTKTRFLNRSISL